MQVGQRVCLLITDGIVVGGDSLLCIVDAAVKYGVPLELNANGVRKGKSRFVDGDRYPYPHFKLFEKISDAKVPVMINSDCHQLKELDDEAMKMSHELVKEWNLIYQDVLELR